MEKQKDFYIKKGIDSQPEKNLSEDGCCRSNVELQDFMAAKLKVNFLFLLRVVLLVSEVILSA